jgi:hypothetical protein
MNSLSGPLELSRRLTSLLVLACALCAKRRERGYIHRHHAQRRPTPISDHNVSHTDIKYRGGVNCSLLQNLPLRVTLLVTLKKLTLLVTLLVTLWVTLLVTLKHLTLLVTLSVTLLVALVVTRGPTFSVTLWVTVDNERDQKRGRKRDQKREKSVRFSSDQKREHVTKSVRFS